MDKKIEETFSKAKAKWGVSPVEMAFKEMAELMVVLSKANRAKDNVS